MAPSNPLHALHDHGQDSFSVKRLVIAGIAVNIFGLAELADDVTDVACLWLHHPRGDTAQGMMPVATRLIRAWNDYRKHRSGHGSRGLLAITFDQRNHGTRCYRAEANKTWREGNTTHAQDMFSIYQGTAADTSQLISYLPAYIFTDGRRRIVEHLVLGISLGGHSAWQTLVADPRITTGIIIIGCPDFTSLMSHRARLSKLFSWVGSKPPGSHFIGSVDFPPVLVRAVEQYDPAGLLSRKRPRAHSEASLLSPAAPTVLNADQSMAVRLQGKRILNLAGAADKLVPYTCCTAFLQWVKSQQSKIGCSLDELVYDGVGHEVPPAMLEQAQEFLIASLDRPIRSRTSRRFSTRL